MAAVTRHLHRIAPALACGLALAAGGCELGGGSSGTESRSASRGGTITGAGPTLPLPLYRRWAKGFQDRDGTDVRYKAVGLSRGVSDFTAALVDFATIDAPLNDVEMTTAATDKSRPLHIPVAFGAVVVGYRVRGVGDGLRLDGATLAAIFLGRITRWNAAAIRRLNPGRMLPATPIVVVHRADSAGATLLFTSFLAASSSEWSRRVGADKAVPWPVGRAAVGSPVGRTVAETEGAIGYVDAGAPRPAGVSRAVLRNRAGRFVAPAPATLAAATRGAGSGVPEDLRFLGVGASGDPAAYPIASPIFMLTFRDLCRVKIQPDDARHVSRWLAFLLSPAGQRLAATTSGFAALAPELAARARAQTKRLACDGKRL